ncbi:hypothetical protein PTSG_06774 [Salpingoeca rosetta]|uniref:Transmembrane protein 170A n=1 Tax=Salpingoeca rosetta (strain ATCC 50818 / BSB-021) TaxID=946362 RepID=F2UER9_SALR5|nr:uncharacterized protein PTSG_06774 [Salpingoeca rosetta]EGD75119.1 hypothetical protein PTSG_06774 [Salpingoeca rosetta]|eukprot:XP_004992172.1 hypothetical protein PTSG_06774 [Salpingoeca rosetta]
MSDVKATDLQRLFSFRQHLNTFHEMWLAIWTWELGAFAVSHAIAGFIAFLRFRKDTKFAWIVPLFFLLVGGIICATAGVITALLIASIYTQLDITMTTTEAMIWGVGQFGLYFLSSFYHNYQTL